MRNQIWSSKRHGVDLRLLWDQLPESRGSEARIGREEYGRVFSLLSSIGIEEVMAVIEVMGGRD
jgi:hypothetical protein